MRPRQVWDSLVPALSDPTRRQILLSFYESPGPRTVAEVTAGAAVHRSVVYGHLEKLLGLGYLDAGSRRGRPGKPAKTYRLSADAPPAGNGHEGLQTLAHVLARAVVRLGSGGAAAATKSAVEVGRMLAIPGVSGEAALEPLRRLGDHFTADSTEFDLWLDRCAFRAACRDDPKVVPTVHAALIEGVLRGSGRRTRVRPARCAMEGCHFQALMAGGRRQSGDSGDGTSGSGPSARSTGPG